MEKELHELQEGSKIMIDTDNGRQQITFHHCDGMYSYCTVDEGFPDASKVVNLSRFTPLWRDTEQEAYQIKD